MAQLGLEILQKEGFFYFNIVGQIRRQLLVCYIKSALLLDCLNLAQLCKIQVGLYVQLYYSLLGILPNSERVLKELILFQLFTDAEFLGQ